MSLVIRLIAALDTRQGIAIETGIPWRLPGDIAYFREQTGHGLLVMGSATYREFASPLHGRDNYVLTTHPDTLRAGFLPAGDLDVLGRDHPTDDIWVIGGAAVYAGTIASATELFLTQVQADFNCTKFFPEYRDEFSIAEQSPDHEENGVAYRFEKWRRV